MTNLLCVTLVGITGAEDSLNRTHLNIMMYFVPSEVASQIVDHVDHRQSVLAFISALAPCLSRDASSRSKWIREVMLAWAERTRHLGLVWACSGTRARAESMAPLFDSDSLLTSQGDQALLVAARCNNSSAIDLLLRHRHRITTHARAAGIILENDKRNYKRDVVETEAHRTRLHILPSLLAATREVTLEDTETTIRLLYQRVLSHAVMRGSVEMFMIVMNDCAWRIFDENIMYSVCNNFNAAVPSAKGFLIEMILRDRADGVLSAPFLASLIIERCGLLDLPTIEAFVFCYKGYVFNDEDACRDMLHRIETVHVGRFDLKTTCCRSVLSGMTRRGISKWRPSVLRPAYAYACTTQDAPLMSTVLDMMGGFYSPSSLSSTGEEEEEEEVEEGGEGEELARRMWSDAFLASSANAMRVIEDKIFDLPADCRIHTPSFDAFTASHRLFASCCFLVMISISPPHDDGAYHLTHTATIEQVSQRVIRLRRNLGGDLAIARSYIRESSSTSHVFLRFDLSHLVDMCARRRFGVLNVIFVQAGFPISAEMLHGVTLKAYPDASTFEDVVSYFMRRLRADVFEEGVRYPWGRLSSLMTPAEYLASNYAKFCALMDVHDTLPATDDSFFFNYDPQFFARCSDVLCAASSIRDARFTHRLMRSNKRPPMDVYLQAVKAKHLLELQTGAVEGGRLSDAVAVLVDAVAWEEEEKNRSKTGMTEPVYRQIN